MRRWNPWHERRVDKIFDNYFGYPWNPWKYGRPRELQKEGLDYRTPELEMWETKDSHVFNVELPGVDKKDIKLNATESGITVRVDKKEKGEEEGVRYSSQRQYYRYIQLPENTDPAKVNASYKDGMLNISIPKKEKPGRNIDIM